MRLLFTSVEAAFTTTVNSNLSFINAVLSYMFHQVVTAAASPFPSNSSLLTSPLSSVGVNDKGEQSAHTEARPFVRFSQHVPALILPDDISVSPFTFTLVTIEICAQDVQ